MTEVHTKTNVWPASGDVGVDVSHHNGFIHWTEARRSGVKWAVVKATEHTGFRDPRHDRNMAAARAADVVAYDYHFALPDPAGDPVAQAKAEADWFNLHARGLVAVLDWESTGRKASTARRVDLGSVDPGWQWRWIEAWCERIYSLGRYDAAVVYADRHVAGPLAKFHAQHSTPRHLPLLWLAEWAEKHAELKDVPAGAPPGWKDHDLWAPTWWQWADQGTVEGITGAVDLDVAV